MPLHRRTARQRQRRRAPAVDYKSLENEAYWGLSRAVGEVFPVIASRVTLHDVGASKPTMFIGSSVEGKLVAETIQEDLDYEVASTVWHQGVFGLSGGTLETLVASLDEYDFATLVLTADDLIEKRNVSDKSPRDNVLLELGLFIGALGRYRTFIVHSRTNPPMLPTDLAGITTATYEERPNLRAALGPACTSIKRAISKQGIRRRPSSGGTLDSEIVVIKDRLTEHHNMLNALFQRLTSSPPNPSATSPGTGLDFLAGAWLSSVGSHAYCRMHEGRPHLVYCYEGNSELTGEYFDFRRITDEIVGRFRWFSSDIRGFAWFRIESPDRLEGAWWMEGQVPAHAHLDPERLRQSKGMNKLSWTRQSVAQFPAWALAALGKPG